MTVTLISAGCGGTSTNTGIPTPPAGPAAYGLGSSAPNSSTAGVEVSGLGLPANPATPTANDVGYDTFATAITPLGSTPQPLIVQAAAGATITGEAATPLGGPVPPSQAGVTFRAEVANGVSGTGVPKIISVVLTSADPQWTLGALTMTFLYTTTGTPALAGPFVNAPYSTAPFTLPFTTDGAHTVSVTVTDDAGQSTRTDYTITVGTPVVAAPEIRAAKRH